MLLERYEKRQNVWLRKRYIFIKLTRTIVKYREGIHSVLIYISSLFHLCFFPLFCSFSLSFPLSLSVSFSPPFLSLSLTHSRCTRLYCISRGHSHSLNPSFRLYSFLSFSLSVLSSLSYQVISFFLSLSFFLTLFFDAKQKKPPRLLVRSQKSYSRCHALKILPHSLPRVYHAKGVQKLGRQKQSTSTWNCHGTAFESGMLFSMDEERNTSWCKWSGGRT